MKNQKTSRHLNKTLQNKTLNAKLKEMDVVRKLKFTLLTNSKELYKEPSNSFCAQECTITPHCTVRYISSFSNSPWDSTGGRDLHHHHIKIFAGQNFPVKTRRHTQKNSSNQNRTKHVHNYSYLLAEVSCLLTKYKKIYKLFLNRSLSWQIYVTDLKIATESVFLFSSWKLPDARARAYHLLLPPSR